MAESRATGSSLFCWSTECGSSKQSTMRNKSCCALEVASIGAQNFTRHPVENRIKKSQSILESEKKKIPKEAIMLN